MHTEFLKKVDNRTARVSVIGLGYVGLPLSLVFVRAGFHVLGLDIDGGKIAKLNSGESYIRHFGSEEIKAARATGRFEASGDFDRLVQSDAIIICVPTPLTEKHEPDLSFVCDTTQAVASRLRPGHLIVLESSTYPGTTEEVVMPLLEVSGVLGRERPLQAAATASGVTVGSVRGNDNERFYLAYSPEREDPGNLHFSTYTIPKLVGGIDASSTEAAVGLYSAAFASVVPVNSAKVAEMAKILENTYRCVNIALVNELKQLCLRMGIDIWQVIAAASTKPFGFQPFYPGPGLGGHCIPIDPFYLSWKAYDYDFSARFIQLAGEINREMPYKIVEAVMAALNQCQRTVSGARILVMGLAYKKDIDDMRESPAIKIISLLRQHNADVSYFDPHCPLLPASRQNGFTMESIGFQPEDAANYDAVVIVTDHSSVDYRAVVRHAHLVIDTRNATAGIVGANIVRC